jgi:hypothetical protein
MFVMPGLVPAMTWRVCTKQPKDRYAAASFFGGKRP